MSMSARVSIYVFACMRVVFTMKRAFARSNVVGIILHEEETNCCYNVFYFIFYVSTNKNN